MEAIITYRPNSQKIDGLFDIVLTNDILTDICFRITGQRLFRIRKDYSSYNKGRLLFLEYDNVVYYVSLSETNIGGRNSSLQSVPTAINMYYSDLRLNKKICYYFLPHNGNAFTSYHLFMYKLMITAGVNFLNIRDYYPSVISPYRDVNDLILDRKDNQVANASNNSSYVSKSINKIQIYAKTFGANKYESTLLAIAVSHIADRPIDLFNICEQDLTHLPKSSLKTIDALGNVTVHDTSLFLEKQRYFEQSDRTILRSASYLYNLFNRLGAKKCALCGCEIPEIIQGAHIWGVSQISKSNLDDETKFSHAVNGHNGLWLCQNHHKLFDSNIIMIDHDGVVHVKECLSNNDIAFIRNMTSYQTIEERFLSNDFRDYIIMRNKDLDMAHYNRLAI
ncbi:MAG: HNH endonuclease [Bacteroidaceae bacterium]|nr:HNH endonuclease [Bacteroidaceae bacterium]